MNLKLVLLMAFLWLAALTELKAQGEAHVWFFGNKAGIDFNNGQAEPRTDGQLYSSEGCSSISDKSGYLKLYTNGITVWNNNHQIIPGGLHGGTSSSQSSLIVPQPGSENLFYLFTTAQEAQSSGLKYSIVDTDANIGSGSIISLNNALATQVSEKLTAVLHQNGRDIWIISHEWNSNSFLAYLLSNSGLNENPIISSSGTIHQGDTKVAIGCMKASPNGKKLALAISRQNKFELFDFNNQTGQVNNPIELTTPSAGQTFGVSFSPNSQMLYGTEFTPQRIYQWNLSNYTPAAINSSIQLVADLSCLEAGDLQLGPDGKLYLACRGHNSIGHFSNPNQAGSACNFQHTAIDLQTGICNYGLPNFIQSIFEEPEIECADVCSEMDATFDLSHSNYITEILWDYGDGNQNSISDLNGFESIHSYTQTGNMDIIATINRDGVQSQVYNSLQVSPSPSLHMPSDTILCEGSSLLLDVSPYASNTSFQWQNGSTSPTFLVDEAGVFELEMDHPECGILNEEIEVFYSKSPELNWPSDTAICLNQIPLNFSAEANGALGVTYQWQNNPANNLASFEIQQEGLYQVDLANSCGTSTNNINVDFKRCACEVLVPTAFSPNNDNKNDSFKPIWDCDIQEADIQIFNRWGQSVFKGNGLTDTWDGTQNGQFLPTGVYTWTLGYIGKENNNTLNNSIAGTVVLIR